MADTYEQVATEANELAIDFLQKKRAFVLDLIGACDLYMRAKTDATTRRTFSIGAYTVRAVNLDEGYSFYVQNKENKKISVRVILFELSMKSIKSSNNLFGFEKKTQVITPLITDIYYRVPNGEVNSEGESNTKMFDYWRSNRVVLSEPFFNLEEIEYIKDFANQLKNTLESIGSLSF